MKTATALCTLMSLFLLCGCASTPQTTTTPSYQGTATIAGLGQIAFPPGEWVKEFQHIEPVTNNIEFADYFVFKRKSDRLERLTFMRYPRRNPPTSLEIMTHPVFETLTDGIPWRENSRVTKTESSLGGGEVFPILMEPFQIQGTERELAFSCIHSRPEPDNSWICHSQLFRQDNAVFIIVHASTSVLSPDTVEKVKSGSRLIKMERQAKYD